MGLVRHERVLAGLGEGPGVPDYPDGRATPAPPPGGVQAPTDVGLSPVTTKTTRFATETAWSAIRS